MLTRLEVNGFKNLVDFSLDLGPYTCIAGANGVGKSNIFDAIRFLSLLTDRTINESALQIRSSGQDTGRIADLFFTSDGRSAERMEFAAEMIVDREVVDDFGRQGKSSSTFLRYEVAFRHEPPSASAGPLGGLVLEREKLHHIPSGKAVERLGFPHSAAKFRGSVIHNTRRGSGYISTTDGTTAEPGMIVIHQDGGSSGRARPAAKAERAPRTIIGTENTAATPTILAARREMQGWRILALEPSAMRRPDKFTDTPGITADGGHIPVTLDHLAQRASASGNGSAPDDILGRIVARLSGLVPVRAVRPVRDDVRQLFSIELEERSGICLQANSISDGTLRFLALAAIAEATDTAGLYCMEEPENGIHPEKLSAMSRLLHDIAVDADEAVDDDNPLQQVIVATHSPYFVQLQAEQELVLAKNPAVRSVSGEAIWPLKCYPMQGTWRDRKDALGADATPGIGKLELLPYLVPPDAPQTSLPAEFWRGESSART